MFTRRDMLKAIMFSGISAYSGNLFSNLDMCELLHSLLRDHKRLDSRKRGSANSCLPNGCVLTTLARVISICRESIPPFDENKQNWVELYVNCLGLNGVKKDFPLTMPFLGSDLIKAQEINLQEKIAKVSACEVRDLIEKLKDKVVQDLKEDTIIVVSGQLYLDKPGRHNIHHHFIMNPHYELQPYEFTDEQVKALFENSKIINEMKRKYSFWNHTPSMSAGNELL